METTEDLASVPAEVPVADDKPKLDCDVTIVVRNGELKALKVKSIEDLTYNQLKEICAAGAQRVDIEFTNRCKKLNAMVYEPDTL